MRVCINTIDDRWDNRVVPLDPTWETFRDVILEGHVVADHKHAVKLFNASEYKAIASIEGRPECWVYDQETDRRYTRRLKENVVAVTLLILDYDGGMSLLEAKERFKDLEYVGYTSFRHLNDKGIERFRLVFPLAMPIPAAGEFTDCDDLIQGSVWYELTEALAEFAGPCDPASFRCNQFFYLPVTSKAHQATAQFWSNSGSVLDWSSWKRSPPQKYESQSSQDASSDRRSTKHHLDPNQVLRSQQGRFRVRDVLSRIEGVWCPFHDDKNGTEFIKRIPASGDVFLFCRRCNQTFWMSRGAEDDLLVMDARTRQADFIDATDRTHVNKQLKKIGQSIQNARRPTPSVSATSSSPYQLPTHLVYLPEGTGKSALAFDLAASGMKILFACKSLEQVFEKYEWFKEKAKQHAKNQADRREALDLIDNGEFSPIRQAPVNVQLFLGKGGKARRRFGVDAVRRPPKDPFDSGQIDDEASIQAFKEAKPKLSEEFIRLSWHFFAPDRLYLGQEPHPIAGEGNDLDDKLSGSEKFNTADVIVTTFAQVRLLNVRNQRVSWDWTIWFDDPDVTDFSDLEPYDQERWGESSEDQEQGARIVTRDATGQKYFTRDKRQSLGSAVRRHRCVYTTTEKVTLRAAKAMVSRRDEYVIVHDQMEGVIGGKVTLLGTNKVYSSYDAIIPLMVRRLAKEGHEVQLIADGLGQSLNHSNTKGKNDLRERNLVIELSSPHPTKVKTICDAMGLAYQTEGKEIGKEMVLDQLHQALGRNSGYRFAGRECVALVPANMHATILREVRYGYDERNSVIVDRLVDMGRNDRRTTEGASPLVLAIEQFLNNFSVYIQDKRKVVPDVTYVIERIKGPGDQLAYTARLLYALTNLSGTRFDKAPTDADRTSPLYEHYRAVADAVLGKFPTDTARKRVLVLYRRRFEDEVRRLEARKAESEGETGGVSN